MVTKKKHKHIATCPSCNTMVICEGELGKTYLIKCPSCGHKGIISFKKEKKQIKQIDIEEIEQNREKNEKDVPNENKYLSINQLYKIHIVGKPLILIGIGLLIISLLILIIDNFLITTLNLILLKLSFTLIFIGYLLIFINSDTRRPKRIIDEQLKEHLNPMNNIELFMPEIISLGIIIWTLVLFFITSHTSDTDFEIFFICVFLGLLAAKQLTDRYTTIQLKKRMNMFLFIFFIGTVLIIAIKTYFTR